MLAADCAELPKVTRKSPVREFRTPGCGRGAARKGRPHRERGTELRVQQER